MRKIFLLIIIQNIIYASCLSIDDIKVEVTPKNDFINLISLKVNNQLFKTIEQVDLGLTLNILEFKDLDFDDKKEIIIDISSHEVKKEYLVFTIKCNELVDFYPSTLNNFKINEKEKKIIESSKDKDGFKPITNTYCMKNKKYSLCKKDKYINENLSIVSFWDENRKVDKIYNFFNKDYPLKMELILTHNLTKYNDIAYYLEKAKAYKESIYLLEKILEKYPKRTVAYLNIADAYWGDENKEKAIENYKIYIKQMKENGKENKIPKKVFDRVNIKDIKKDTVLEQIQTKKQYLYSNPNNESKTKMYLLKGDKIEILKEENNWLYVLYKGKKDIKAWIPKSSIEEQKIKPISKIKEIKEEKTFFTKLLEFFNLSQLNKNINVMQS